MNKTLLAVGPWKECGKIIASVLANRWSVVHTLLFEDIPKALERVKVDLVLLAGRSSADGWEGAVLDIWSVTGAVPIVALASDESQDSLVSAFVGTPVRVEAEATHEMNDSGTYSLDGIAGSFHRSFLSPSLILLEPGRNLMCVGVKQALDFIEAHYAEKITLSDVAAAASYSRCHFSKIFKEQLGVCFVSYLSRVRIRHAAELLARSDMSVTELALEAGFNDLSHFERVFRATQRESPTKYRLKTKNMQRDYKNPPSRALTPVA